MHWRTGDSDRILDVRLTPLSSDGVTMGTSIAYIDVTEAHKLQDQLTGSKRELEQAYEELQSTVEELETTNEELQSTNEELETTNEELQSTNEELETMNEELQSSNEELETMNEELRHRNPRAQRRQLVPRDDPDHDRARGGGARPQPARPDLERQGPGAVGPNGRGGRGRAPDVARRRPAGREGASAAARHPGGKVSARGSRGRGDQPARKGVHVPRHAPSARAAPATATSPV